MKKIDVNLNYVGSTFRSQSGFTLIELMIAILLGLLIAAAAVSVLISSSRSVSIQEGNSSIQDSVVFPFNQLKHHLRRANYGAGENEENSGFFLSHDTPQGGVVLTAQASAAAAAPGTVAPPSPITNLEGLTWDGTKIKQNLLTVSNHSDSNMIGEKNDQLTIQYQMTSDGYFDCQGRKIPVNHYVIERYFVKDSNLRCASTNYLYDETAAKTHSIDIKKYNKLNDDDTITREESGFDGDGTLLIPNVDYFRTLFGITDKKNFATDPSKLKIKYVAPLAEQGSTEDKQADRVKVFDKNRIVDIQLGLILRSTNSTNTGSINDFNVLDKTSLQIDTSKTNTDYVRDVVESTILIRNARGRD